MPSHGSSLGLPVFKFHLRSHTCNEISVSSFLPNVIGVGPVLMSNDELGLAGLSFLDLSNFFSLLGNC